MRTVLIIILAMRIWTRPDLSLEQTGHQGETLSVFKGTKSPHTEDVASTTWRSLEGFAYSIAVHAFREALGPALTASVVSDLASASSDLALWLMTHKQPNEAECVLRATVDDLAGVLAWAEGDTRDASVEGLADAASELGFLLASQGRKDEVAALLTRCQRALALEIHPLEALEGER